MELFGTKSVIIMLMIEKGLTIAIVFLFGKSGDLKKKNDLLVHSFYCLEGKRNYYTNGRKRIKECLDSSIK